MDHPKSWLRYVTASDFEDTSLKLDGLRVSNAQGEDLGSVRGLVIHSDTGRPLYVVVSAGGWFQSKRFLVPIGEASVADDRQALRVALTKEQVKRFPGFDTDEFERLSEEQLRRINKVALEAFEPGVEWPDDGAHSVVWERESYRTPDWWSEGKHESARPSKS